MKSRKALAHTPLLDAVIDQVKARFKPDVSLIKKMIEHLIDKGFLERRDGGYTYLA